MNEYDEWVIRDKELNQEITIIRQTLEQWRDMLSPVFIDGKKLGFDMSPTSLKQEIERILNCT